MLSFAKFSSIQKYPIDLKSSLTFPLVLYHLIYLQFSPFIRFDYIECIFTMFQSQWKPKFLDPVRHARKGTIAIDTDHEHRRGWSIRPNDRADSSINEFLKMRTRNQYIIKENKKEVHRPMNHFFCMTNLYVEWNEAALDTMEWLQLWWMQSWYKNKSFKIIRYRLQ